MKPVPQIVSYGTSYCSALWRDHCHRHSNFRRLLRLHSRQLDYVRTVLYRDRAEQTLTAFSMSA